jgi:hypothetical protein
MDEMSTFAPQSRLPRFPRHQFLSDLFSTGYGTPEQLDHPLGMPRAKRWLVVNLELSKREDETVLAIGGRLLGSDLAELQRVRGGISGSVMLSLEDLLSADEENLRELRDWIEHGARTQGASPYLHLLLEPTPSPDQPEDPPSVTTPKLS